jgi:hypothetical protein
MSFMSARKNKVLIAVGVQAASLALIAGVATYVVGNNLIGDANTFTLQLVRFFCGIFFTGALVLALIGALRPGIDIVRKLNQRPPSLDERLRPQIEAFVMYVVQAYVSIAGMLICGFVGWKF